MNDLAGARLIVVGAGVFGLAVATEAGRRGASCIVLDPEPVGANASGVAAGMLAPASEHALDGAAAGRFDLLLHARDLWPDFARSNGLEAPEQSGAVWLDPDGTVGTVGFRRALERERVPFRLLDREAIAALLPCAAGTLEGVFTGEDWRVEPAPALGALRNAVPKCGGAIRADAVVSVRPRSVSLQTGEAMDGDAVVICAGWGSHTFTEAPEVTALEPIKGEILRFPETPPFAGPAVRTPAGYLVPSAAGVLAGATMEQGVEDRRSTPEAVARLRAMAAAVFPHLASAPSLAAAGVRASTPDSLPLVGRSRSGVWLATGARRNGWLLAPLVARTLVDAMAGVEEGPWAPFLSPGRFAA